MKVAFTVHVSQALEVYNCLGGDEACKLKINSEALENKKVDQKNNKKKQRI